MAKSNTACTRPHEQVFYVCSRCVNGTSSPLRFGSKQEETLELKDGQVRLVPSTRVFIREFALPVNSLELFFSWRNNSSVLLVLVSDISWLDDGCNKYQLISSSSWIRPGRSTRWVPRGSDKVLRTPPIFVSGYHEISASSRNTSIRPPT